METHWVLYASFEPAGVGVALYAGAEFYQIDSCPRFSAKRWWLN
jgi:hypothetical protein